MTDHPKPPDHPIGRAVWDALRQLCEVLEANPPPALLDNETGAMVTMGLAMPVLATMCPLERAKMLGHITACRDAWSGNVRVHRVQFEEPGRISLVVDLAPEARTTPGAPRVGWNTVPYPTDGVIH